jgi:hypothetical protein
VPAVHNFVWRNRLPVPRSRVRQVSRGFVFRQTECTGSGPLYALSAGLCVYKGRHEIVDRARVRLASRTRATGPSTRDRSHLSFVYWADQADTASHACRIAQIRGDLRTHISRSVGRATGCPSSGGHCLEEAKRGGWSVGRVCVDDDVNAFNPTKPLPEYQNDRPCGVTGCEQLETAVPSNRAD